MAVGPAGKFAYVANFNDNTLSGYNVGPDGALTPLSGAPFVTGKQPVSVAVDANDRFAYATNFMDSSVSAYSIGPNGALTPVASDGRRRWGSPSVW